VAIAKVGHGFRGQWDVGFNLDCHVGIEAAENYPQVPNRLWCITHRIDHLVNCPTHASSFPEPNAFTGGGTAMRFPCRRQSYVAGKAKWL
jgi:hypothetical protein